MDALKEIWFQYNSFILIPILFAWFFKSFLKDVTGMNDSVNKALKSNRGNPQVLKTGRAVIFTMIASTALCFLYIAIKG